MKTLTAVPDPRITPTVDQPELTVAAYAHIQRSGLPVAYLAADFGITEARVHEIRGSHEQFTPAAA